MLARLDDDVEADLAELPLPTQRRTVAVDDGGRRDDARVSTNIEQRVRFRQKSKSEQAQNVDGVAEPGVLNEVTDVHSFGTLFLNLVSQLRFVPFRRFNAKQKLKEDSRADYAPEGR